MKKITVWLAVVSVCSLLCSCGDGSSAYSGSIASASSTSPSSRTIEKKSLPHYMADGIDTVTSSNVNVYFVDGGSVPYLDMKTALSIYNYNRALNPSPLTPAVTMTESGPECTLDFGHDLIAKLNFVEQTITFTDLSSIISGLYGGLTFLPPEAGWAFGIKNRGCTYLPGRTYTLNLNDYPAVSLVERIGEAKLIPVSTFSDIFLTASSQFLAYNTKGIFTIPANAVGNTSVALIAKYVDVADVTLPSDYYDFNYDETCLLLDLYYGLKESHNFVSADSYFERLGLKAALKSGDANQIDQAMATFLHPGLDDPHSKLGFCSPFTSTAPTLSHGMTFYRIMEANTAVKKARAAHVIQDTHYQVVGDTAYVTFDSFESNPMDWYTKTPTLENIVLPSGGVDGLGLFKYTYDQISADDSIKNVVVDLSANVGGQVFVLFYIGALLYGELNVGIENATSQDFIRSTFQADIAFNQDEESYKKGLKNLGKNIAMITSQSSFSCGNLLPCLGKFNDANTLLLGQTSGGGSCTVMSALSPIGTSYRLSSPNNFVTYKNGYIRDIDGGVAPDISLSYERMADRDYVTKLVDDYFHTAA